MNSRREKKLINLVAMFARYKFKQYRLSLIHLHENESLVCTFVHALDASELVVRFKDDGRCLMRQARTQLLKDLMNEISKKATENL